MFCTCAMRLYRRFREGRSNYYSSSFYLICKPTASALENAVNKVTLGFSFSFLLAKIGYLFTREILFFVLLSIGCVATTLEWCLILCLWFSIENVKTVPYLWWKSHRSENTVLRVQLLNDREDFHLLITTYWHITYCHLRIYLGTFGVNERSRQETLKREGREEEFRLYSRCAYPWWEWRLIWFMQMNVAGTHWWISN